MKRKQSLFAKPIPQKKKPKAATPYPETLKIEGLSHEGRGIAKHNGKTIFVAGALPNEEVEYEITSKHRRYDEANCTQVLTESSQRTSPKCEHFGTCGGCDLQHLAHEHQIPTKQTLVLDQLNRLGKFTPEKVEEPITSTEWNYRRSCRIGINQMMRDGSALVGFRRRGSSKLTQIDHCPVLAEPLDKILSALPQVLEAEEQFKEITHGELTLGDNQGALTLRVKKRPSDALCQTLNNLAEQQNFKLYFDHGDKIEAYCDKAVLSYKHQPTATDIEFEPGDFIQVNNQVNQQMIDRAISWLNLEANDRVLDLFCGIGNFSLPLAKTAAHVVGIEGVEDMVARANTNAANNDLDNCEFYRADLSKDLRAMPWYKQGFNKILLDPPRTGALEIIKQLKNHQPEMILYVSCNPAALSRDGAELIEQGYVASRFCVMDMFPHTSHVESMVLFERKTA